MQRIWVLTELYYPERTSTAYFLTEIAQALATDYDVHVLTGAAAFEAQQATPLARTETVNQVHLRRCQGTSFDKNWLPGRLLNGVSRSLSILGQALLRSRPGDAVLVVTNPPLLPLMALILKFIRKTEYVLLVHDVYPDVLAAVGLTHPGSILYRLTQSINCWIYQNAQQIITLGRDMNQLTQIKLGDSPGDKIICIPNWAEIESIHPLAKQESSLLQKLGISDKFVVLYAGNMGRTHDIEILLEAAEILQRESSNIHFLFIGAGVKKPLIETAIEQQSLSNVTALSYLPHEEKNTSINACDLSVISFLPGMAGVSVPSRMYNQMAAGKPLLAIADEESELTTVVKEESIGWHVPPKELDRLLDVLREASSNPMMVENMGQRAAAVVQAKYTLAHAANAYRGVFNRLF